MPWSLSSAWPSPRPSNSGCSTYSASTHENSADDHPCAENGATSTACSAGPGGMSGPAAPSAHRVASDRLLHLMQYRSVLAAAAGRTAAFADVAAARRAHLRAAGEAEWRIGRPALLRLDELGGAVRLQRRLGARTPLR